MIMHQMMLCHTTTETLNPVTSRARILPMKMQPRKMTGEHYAQFDFTQGYNSTLRTIYIALVFNSVPELSSGGENTHKTLNDPSRNTTCLEATQVIPRSDKSMTVTNYPPRCFFMYCRALEVFPLQLRVVDDSPVLLLIKLARLVIMYEVKGYRISFSYRFENLEM
jgi:hypothetical protein